MELRSGGPPPPPRGKRIAPAYHDERSEPSAGAGYHVPRRLGERELDRNQDRIEETATYATPAPRNILAETPETTVGENVHVKGELSFDRLLRVDGSFKGQLVSTGDLVIGATGVVRGNIEHLREVVSDGTVVGNIQAERVRLRRSAIVIGNITCNSLSMDPDVSISGKLNVHIQAPSRLHLEGEEEAPEDEVADSSGSADRLDDKSGDSGKQKSSKKDGNTKKEKDNDGTERDRRPKEDKKEDKNKDEPRRKKDGESSKNKSK
ncbi:unnamed protein product [Ectocarpus sp. 13 AM-2016]